MILKIKDNLKYIQLQDVISVLKFILMCLPAFLYKQFNKIRKKELWLICETSDTARDNGYCLFTYIIENHPECWCYYAIDFSCKDYRKLENYKNIINFGTLRHWFLYLSANKNISSQKGGNPCLPLFYVLHVVMGLYNNRYFLQHGITKDDAKWLYYEQTRFKLFVCGAKPEYEFVKQKFHYPNEAVQLLGLSRFDRLNKCIPDNKMIVLMPTWRNWLGRKTNQFSESNDFEMSSFYHSWQSLLKNKDFHKIVDEFDLTVYFYPHYQMQKFLDYFESNHPKIHIVHHQEFDIQELLQKAKILITDYSSVYMDFAYMRKAVLYYQFDLEEYRQKQYQDGYFSYQENGFGPVCYQQSEVCEMLLNLMINNALPEEKYKNRMDDFFQSMDTQNCERNYQAIKRLS